MSSKRKFNRKSKYTLSQKIISAVTAAGFIMQPFTAFAGEIVKPGGENLIKDNVANIWADRVVDKTAINVFNKFNLSANEIANMYFGLKGTNHNSTNLVNFVNDRIDINGTVNAIQNSQIGGNLFFLSKEGMAVGKSGVINTGSLYVMTPTPDFMEAVQTVGTEAPAEDANKYLGYITNITDPTKANAWEIIPVNTSGTITVLGKVNATNEVQMRAAKIGVGKNVSGELKDDEGTVIMEANAANKEAYIKTGITNFADIVNIKNADGTASITESGLTGDLQATQTGNGDIVLSAYVDASNDKNEIEKLPVIGGTTLGTTAESVENTFTEQEFAASVDIYGEVNATGKADISAAAINSNADFDETLNDYKANNNDVAQLATVKADVNIGGTVKAADDVNIKAEAVNRYVDNTGGFAKALSVGISSGTPLTGDVAYSVLDTEANVNVASGANVESENGSVDIDAKAETLAASAASTTGLKFKAAGGLNGANVPATAVVYTGVDNKANVTVEGNIEAGNDISIDADADMKVEADNKMSLKGKMANQFVVGVTVAGAENSASVDIKGSGNKVSAGNDLSVNAKADSDFTSNTSIKAPEASAITVAVNVTDFNSNANVNVNTDLTAGNNLNVEADNTIVSDNVNAETKLGSNKYISAATQVVTTNAEGKITEVKNFINGLKTKLGFEAGGSDDVKTQLQLSEILKAGATVTYSGQEHKSGVNIGKNGSLTAQNGMLDVNAETLIEDAHIAATGTTYSYNDAYPAGATLNASVLVNNMDNSSSVVVADRDAASTEPALSGKTGVDVNASVRFEYNRIKNMIQDVKDAYNQIEKATESLGGAIKTDFVNFLGTLQTQITSWEIAFATANETLATSDSGVLSIGDAATAGYDILNALNKLNTMLDSPNGSEVADATKASIQGASDLLSSALAFIDPNSYGNFAASSASKGSSGNQSTVGGHIPSAINGAGTVIVNNVDTVSKVEIGSNTGIASDRDVNINAESFMKDVTLGGLNAMPITNSGGGTTASIGATVNYSDFNTDTVVAVNNGASITGGNINIAGSNVIDHVSVAGSAGVGPSGETQSGGIVLNGMLSFVNGSSDILTVVDDGASLTAKQNEYTETVKDEETGTDKETKKYTEGNISITGHNNSNIVNVAAGLNFGTGSGAVGVGLAYTDFAVKNIAGVADVVGQIENLYSSKDDNGNITVDNSKVDELDGELNNTYTASTASSDTKGSISAYGFNVDAATDGSIQSVSAAASANKNDDTGKESFFGKLKGKFSNVENKVFNKLDEKTGQIFGSDSGKANEMFNKGSSSHGTGGGIKLVGSTSGKGGFMPSFSIAGSGSVSLNSLNNATEAVVDNAKISMKDKGDISVTARDALYAGAYSGAAALQWKKGGSSSDKAVGFAGAAGVNDIDNVVKAVVKNSTIENAGKFNTMALSGGEQLALGLGLAVEKTGSTSGYSGNAAVSVNLIDHDVEALLENNKVTNTDDVNVSAYARDIENTGGGTLSAGQQKVGVGATVAVAQLNNNISAGIKGGSYTDVGNVDVDAMNALKNITVGIAAGLTIPSDGNAASANVEGAGVYNEVHNTTNAFIEGNDTNNKVGIETVDGGEVSVIAQDVAINNDYEKVLTNELTDGKEEIAERMGSGFDITGASELSGIETGDIEAQLNNKDAEGTGTQSNENSTEEVNLNKDSGSSIITVAGGLAATTGKGAGGAAVAITDIENTYTADVKYADITADELDVDAGSNSNIVTVAGGIAAANKGSGVGSVSWNDVINTANVNIANSHIYAQQTTATAASQAQIVSVGGQISGAGKAAVGATLSYVGLDNTTKVNISTTDFDERTDGGTSVTAEANNTSDSYNIGAGVSAAGEAAVSGTVVVTQTKGTAGAVMDGAKINNAKEIIAHASDDTDILSVIGTVNIAGKAAVGAGVAYTEIGGVSDDKEKAEQHVTAEIKNSTINTAAEGTKIEVKAEDNSKVTNIAVGVGGALRAAVQGASATTLINKATTAGINNTQIDAPVTDEEGNSTIEGSQKANVTVDAQNNSEITSSADTASVAGQGVAAGASIAVNRIIQQTNADVNGGVMNVNNLKVNANGTPRIENVGIGIAVAAQGAGATGSVAVNMIQNDVTAHIGSGANIVADGSVGVIATSDEQIATYAGQAAVAGQGAGVGISVAVNEIAGTTSATVGGEKEDTTSVIAKGNDSITTNTLINVEDEINDALIDGDTVGMDAVIDRQEEERSGLIVDASSTRDMKSFLITAGVAGMGAGVAGTVNVNQINGGTNAGITNAEVNDGNTAVVPGNNANVIVNAGDYSNMSGFVGSVGVGGIGAGAGLASDTNTISREVTAKVDSSDIKAQGFEIDADSAQGVSSFGTGVGAAGIGGGAAGVVTVTELNNTTKTMLNNSKVNANTVNIKANHTGIVNAGNVSVGGAGLGVGGGLSVGVLKDNSTTEVTVKGDKSEEDTITASGDVTIAANNNATVNPMISANGVGAFGGVAGATSINNLNSTVKTNIEGVGITSTGGSISGTADNTFNVKAYMGTIGGGAVGAGAGVTVNTIDSTVQTNVNGSALDAAKDVTLTAKETRNIKQTATNVAAGGLAVGANIAVTNVGQAVENVKDENGEIVSNAADKIEEANKVYGEDNKDAVKLLEGAGSALDTAEIDTGSVTPHVDAGYGGVTDDNGNTVSQITVNITNSNIEAGNNVTAKATETDGVTMTLGGASAGAVAVAAGVGMLNVHRNVGVDISGGSITAGNAVDVGTDITGEAELNVYQGSGGIIGANAAYAGVNTTGSSDINLNGVTIEGKNISIAAQDNAKTSLQAVGVAAGVAALGALAAEAANDSDVSVNMTGTTVTANEDKDDDESGKVEITTNKANTVTAQAVNTAGGAVAGAGMGATVTDTGSSTVYLAANEMFADKLIDVNAKTNSTLKADVLSGSAGWFASGAVSIAKVSADTATAVTIGNGNTFAAQNINFAANSNITESMDMDALAISGYAALGGNSTTSEAYADATVTAEAGNTYKGSDNNAGNVSFNANNTVTQTADTSGISAAGLFATGTNIGTTTSDLKTEVNVKGSGEGSKVNNFNANASSYASVNNKVNGDGGAIADISPYAAMVHNNYTANTDVEIDGDWNTAGSFGAHAVNGMDIKLKSDAVRAAVIGGSGTWLDNTIDNAANVTVNNANITTGGAQNYTAQNNVNYSGEIDGSGYGGINVNATDYSDDLDFTAGVDIKGSTLHGAGDGGSITAFASTQGTINAKNSLKSAGVIPVALAFSDYDIDYNNSVNVDGSTLTTDKKDQNITLAANDNTVVKMNTLADTQGGVAGAASAKANSELNRNNIINIDGGLLHSTNDVNIYAGADTEGILSTLNYDLTADAYNKTVLPVCTTPSINNDMEQNNQVTINSAVESVRHTNLKAGHGYTNITQSAREYNIYTGESGTGSVTSTVLGDMPEDSGEKTTNFVKITKNGSVKAGIHNDLDLTISGQFNVDQNKQDESALDYSGIQITTADGQEWFDTSTVEAGTVEIVNALQDRYNEVNNLLSQYDSNSNEYKILASERDRLITEMTEAGFIVKDENGNMNIIESINIPAVLLPDIVISGGNINIDTDSLTGNGSLSAQGANNLNVTNSSNMYLMVNDLVIKDKGGNINLNNVTIKDNEIDGYNGAVSSVAVNNETPVINVLATGSATNNLTTPNIGIFGTVQNAAGDIIIENRNHSIVVDGDAQISAKNITLKADKGAVTQNSDGLLLVGEDPVKKYQFSDAVSQKIQRFLTNAALTGEDISWFTSADSYEDYINNLLVKNEDGSYKLGFNEAEANEIRNSKQDQSKGILGGSNVYISGLNVNIDGLVQSGYQTYKAELDDKALKKVQELDALFAQNGEALTNEQILGDDNYCINLYDNNGEKSGAVYNTETGVWDYTVKIYYNPATKELISENVEASGGKIYINGAVSSTGSGRIVAMNGTPDISVDTSLVDRDLRVNSITSNDIEGLISIKDTQKGFLTEYRTDGDKVTVTEISLATDGTSSKSTADLKDLVYNPTEDMTIKWTGGTSGAQVVRGYKYTKDFIAWGLIKFNTSDDVLNNQDVQEGKTEITTSTIAGNTPLDTGIVIGVVEGGADYNVSTNTHEDTSNVTVGSTHVEKDWGDPDWLGKILGFGTAIYTWTETTGASTSSTYSLKADKPIEIGFMTGGKGDINVTSNKDMLLAGNITNAEVNGEGKGSVNLTSKYGSVSAIGSANINSDDVNITAATGVNVNHSAIGDSANINIATDSGDIKFVSTGGDLNIEQAVTGGTNAIDATTGSVYLEAQGNLIDAADVVNGDYAVKGQRIDLISNTGAIGSKDKAFTVLGGSELYSSDTMASSVNAQAQGDIVLTQFEGNMRLGTIVSEDGDAVLTVNNGSFVDAHPSENSDSSSAQDKIDRWVEAGLISDKDDAGESTNAAKEAKEERMEALNSKADSLAYDAIYEDVIKPAVEKYQEAADAFSKDETIVAAQQKLQDALLEAGDNQEAIAAANAEYQQVVDNYFDGKGYTADEQKFIANNDKAAATNYVFENSKTNTVNSYKDAAKKLADAFADNADLQAAKDTYLNSYKKASVAYSAEIAAAEAAGASDAEIAAIGDKYQERYDAITNDYLAAQEKVYGGGFTEAEQQLISSYAEVDVDESNYGWSKNQLLYAIQDSVLNAEPGEVQTVETPNVTANNITLNAANGGVGIDGEAKVIDYANLNDEANLKLLAQAKAGDLTWDEENQQVTIRQQQAITVSVKEQDGTYGKVNVTGKDNVYLAGVKDTELNINGVTTDGDIRLQGDKGVNVDGTLTGEDLTIAGGTGNIMGTGSDKYVNTNISGTLDAKAEGSIYISQTGDLSVLAIAAGGLADLKATNNILMSDVEGSTAQGYINAQTLNLTAVGNIGTDGENDNAIRILDNGVVINASAIGDIILAGAQGKDSTGSIVLGDIKGANLDVTSISNINLGREDYAATEEDETVNSNINAGTVELTTSSGSITETEGSAVDAETVKATATQNVLLAGTGNAIDNFVVNGYSADNSLTGNVDLVSTANNENKVVNVEFGKGKAGLTVNNGYVNVSSLGDTSNLNIRGGSVTTTGESAGDVTFTSEGSITADTTVNSAANIVMDADGKITNNGALNAQDNVNVNTTKGAIEIGGSVTAEAGNVNVNTESGDVTTKGEVTGNTDVTINSGAGNVTVGGKVQSVTGSTNINAGTNDGISTDANGNVTVEGEIASGEEVKVSANNGNITVNGSTTASAGNVETTVTGDGNINLNGSVSAGGDVKAEVEGVGDITTGENATVSGTNIGFTTNEGDITTGSDLTAKEDVDLNVNTGDITFGGNVTASDGNITIDITGDGNLQDAENKDNTLTAISVDGSEDAGNIIIRFGGAGDVDLYDLYATNAARIDIANGSLTLHEINGELVAMQLRTEGKDMNVENIVAGTQIVLTGSDMTLDQIAQRPDADGMLVITPDNAEADKPIDNFTIGDIKTNSDSGIRFDRLWVNNSDIHISEGQLWFDKLYVEDNAHFSNDEMTAAIYGKPPLRDGSDSVYWINTEENRPESSLDMWLNGTGDWMYLRFTDDHIQESNGILLTLDEYDYVYDQRFTAENHLRWQHGRYLDEDWKQAYGYGLSLHNRYGLIDYQEFTETNAGADEVAVEA